MQKTHNVAMASPLAQFVVSLGTDGRIATQGSVKDAIKKNKALAKELKHEDEAVELDEAEERLEGPGEDKKGKLVLAEEIEEGHVTREACKDPADLFSVSVVTQLFS